MPLADKLYLGLVLVAFIGFFGLLMSLSWLDRVEDRKQTNRNRQDSAVPDLPSHLAAE
jgi:hypothetical protein